MGQRQLTTFSPETMINVHLLITQKIDSEISEVETAN